MAGYAKLFHSIVHSTIWREEDHVRLVWITMLAIADKNGFVEASVPGLADISRVTMEECEGALKKLSSPDSYSRSQDYEGRRIEAIDGGWLLLNYTKYRGAIMEEKIKEQNRIRQQRYRDSQKKARNATVTRNAKITSHNTCNAQSDPDPSPDPSPDPIKKESKKKKFTYPADFEDWYLGYPWKVGKMAACKEWLKAKKNGLPELAAMKAKLEQQVASYEWTKDGGKWVPKPKNYLKDGCYDDEIRETGRVPQKETAAEAQLRRNYEVLEQMQEEDEEEEPWTLDKP